ncbi:MAG: glycerophosphodiester phosphodiesterase [Pseudobdellovibrio sp.]
MSLFWQKNNLILEWLPRIQSHRGYCVSGLQENTLASIQKAFSLGYQMVEFDVRMTADGVLVLHHDEYCDGFKLEKNNYEKLKNSKVVDSLEQVLDWLASQKNNLLKYNIELKSRSIISSKLERKMCYLIMKYDLGHQVLVSSFNPLALAWVRFYMPSMFRALLLSFEDHADNKWYLKLMVFNFLSRPHVLNLRFQDWDNSIFSEIIKKVPIVLWTCNDLLYAKKVLNQVHGIISDEIIPQSLKD